MIAKKNPKVDLEKKRFAFFQIGLLVAGSLTLAAFEYTSINEKQLVYNPLENENTGITVEPIIDFILPDEEPKKTAKIIDLANVDSLVLVDKIIPDGDSKFIDNKDPEKIIIGIGDGGSETNIGLPIVPKDPIVEVPDIEAEFLGGEEKMAYFIQQNINIPNGINSWEKGGIVYVAFVVNRDGSIEQAKVVKGVSQELDEAALKVVNKMPKWKPGEQAGKPVRVRFTLPIKIVL